MTKNPHPLSGADPIWSRIASEKEVIAVGFLIVTFWVAIAALVIYATVK